jgi:cyclophilin family peptidyl-prolyl cis-trans isomerase
MKSRTGGGFWASLIISLLAWCWLVAASGCGQKPAEGPDEPPSKPASVPPPAKGAPVAQARAMDPQLHKPFKEATIAEPPENQWLPEVTKTGKSIGKLYETIAGKDGCGGLWDQIVFVSPSGKRLAYTATLKTSLGAIVLELWPDVAPSHVRSFLALAKASYFDGLEFDRTVREELDAAKGQFFECVEAGCPVGTGEPNYGSIGYWLKPELSDKVRHEPGTVGAWHAEELETAACKFYITLTPAPWMDGSWTIFGKVKQGLDVVRAIRNRPVQDDELRDRPRQPVVIESVTLQCREVE